MRFQALFDAGRPDPGRWATVALVIFIVVKIVWAMSPTQAMGVPRLGDDALVYLWAGASSVVSPKANQPAIRDIEQFRKVDHGVDKDLEFAKARVTMRTTGITPSPIAIGTGMLLTAGFSHKIAFALTESLIALLLGIAIWWCLTSFFSSGAAGIGLTVLAFAILPNQGLHYLIASVAVLAMALIIWTMVIKSSGNRIGILVVSTLMLLSHPIGQVYVLVAIALVAGRGVMYRTMSRAMMIQIGMLIAGVGLWLAITELSGARQPVTGGLGGLSFSTILENASGLAGHIGVLFLTQPVLGLLLVAGLLRIAKGFRRDPDTFVLAGVLAAVVVSTLVIDIPGYPGELPSRALVALLIVCCGASAQWCLEKAHAFRWGGAFVGGVATVAALSQLPLYATRMFDNLNSRHQVLDGKAVKLQIDALKPGASIVWVDTNIAMMTALLEGADRVHAVPYPMLSGPTAVRDAVAGASEVLVATSLPGRLNGVSTIQSRSLQPRYYGYGFDLYRRISLYADAGVTLPGYLRVEGIAQDEFMVKDEAGVRCHLEPVSTPPGQWLAIRDCRSARELHMESISADVRLTGLSVSFPQPLKSWPWGSDGWTLRAEPKAPGEAPQPNFSLSYLLTPTVASDLQSQLGPMVAVSDIGGIVWLRPETHVHLGN